MNQHDLDREIARATGESVVTIAAMGFSLLALPNNQKIRRPPRRRRFPARIIREPRNRPLPKRKLKTRAIITSPPSVIELPRHQPSTSKGA